MQESTDQILRRATLFRGALIDPLGLPKDEELRLIDFLHKQQDRHWHRFLALPAALLHPGA